MTEPHANALFHDNESKFLRDDDGNILGTRSTQYCECELAAYRAMIEALPEEPSERFKVMTQRMAEIQEVPRPSVIDPTKGEDECKTTKSTTFLDQQSSTSSQPEAMITKT